MENESEMSESQESNSGRTLRKRSSKPPIVTKRRKSEGSFNLNEEISIEDVYRQDINKIANFQPSSLETIYESPRGKTNFLKDFMGVVKLKRQCRFSAFYDPPKIKVKQRKNKAKSLKRIGVKSSSAKVTLEQVEQAMKEISGDEDEENNSSISNSNLFARDWCYQGNIIKPDNSFQAVNDLTSTLADMDMSSCDYKVQCNMNTSGTMLFEPNDINEYGSANDLNVLIPSTGVRKLKKNRRRSGRVPPRVLEEPRMDTISSVLVHSKSTINESSSVIECSNIIVDSVEANCLTSVPGKFFSGCNTIIDKSNSHQQSLVEGESLTKRNLNKKEIYSSLEKPKDSALEMLNKNSHVLKKSTKRRTSGVRRPLYRSLLNCTNELEKSLTSATLETMPKLEDCCSQQLSQPVNKTCSISSPTLLFDNLKIDSPSSMISNNITKSRRRSARLGLVGLKMGSLWTDNKTNKTTDILSIKESIDDFKTPISGQQNYFCSEIIPSQSSKSSSISGDSNLRPNFTQNKSDGSHSPNSNNLVATDGFMDTIPVNFFEHSPIVSGMFDGKTRIFNGKKFVVQQSQYSVKLDPFKSTQSTKHNLS